MCSSSESICTELDDEEDIGMSSDDGDSESLSPEALNYEYLNGRRYHGFKAGAYALPNDDEEQERMNLLHAIWKTIVGDSLTRTTLRASAKRILDVGTGTGLWAIDMADGFHKAEVIGTDLSPIQPQHVPENCRFYVDDAECEWDWESPFDLIHARCLAGSIADWPRFYRQCFDNLHPGGQIEIQEHEIWANSHKGVPPWTASWQQDLHAAFATWGKELSVATRHAQWMRDAGFVDVRDDVYQVPIGAWARDKMLKTLGQWNQEQMLAAVEPYTLVVFNDVLKRSPDETQVTVEMVKGEMRTAKNHLFVKYHIVTGRRP